MWHIFLLLCCHYAECHYVECHYADCHFAECHYTDCHYGVSLCWVSFCWVSLCWVPLCWVSFYWVSLCWMSLCWLSRYRLVSSTLSINKFLKFFFKIFILKWWTFLSFNLPGKQRSICNCSHFCDDEKDKDSPQLERISRKQSARWQHLSRLKSSAFLSLRKKISS